MKVYRLDVLYGTKLEEVYDTLWAAGIEVRVIDELRGGMECVRVPETKVNEVEKRLQALKVTYNFWE